MFLLHGDPVFSTSYMDPCGRLERRDAATGHRIWRFDGFDSSINFSEGTAFVHAGGIVINDSQHAHNVDVSGNLLWETDISSKGRSFSNANLINDAIYAVHYHGKIPKITHSSIVRAPLTTGIWDTLLTLEYEYDNYYSYVRPPALWVNRSGDSILIIRDIQMHGTVMGGRAMLYAWNMRTKEFEWTRFDFDPDGHIGTSQPVIDNNRMYITGLNRVYCLDLITGATLWEKKLSKTLMYCNLIQYNNYIIAQANGSGSWALDKYTGALVWNNPYSEGVSYGGRRLVDGVLYHTSSAGHIWAIDAATGKTLWNMRSPNTYFPKTDLAGFNYSSVYVDSVRQVLYASDRYFMMCFKLPER
ncbi:MAG: PQQ-binding-like beta-propeller repeat protein [Saprospiraceae bacterium]|nr:PQQ-binding-like beta-propeller repeat protein [Saprospiraceae bacterium]